jgi:hypothetical protein
MRFTGFALHGRSKECTQNVHHLGDLDMNGRIIFQWILVKQVVGIWTGFIWLRTGNSGGNIVMNIFHKIMGIYWVPKKFLAPREGLGQLNISVKPKLRLSVRPQYH